MRQLFGYYRIEDKTLVSDMNDLCINECSDLRNFFYPAMKLIEKQRIKSKIKNIHDKAKTTYQRLMGSSDITKEQKTIFTEKYHQLNPFQLRANP